MKRYLGIFLIACSILSLEISLSRMMSILSYYYVSFFVISFSMLGLGAGGLYHYLAPTAVAAQRLSNWSLLYVLSIIACLFILCSTNFIFFDPRYPFLSLVPMLVSVTACIIPFFTAGVVITMCLQDKVRPIGRLYAADLFGAAFGCLFVLWALSLFDTSSVIILCAVLGSLGGLTFSFEHKFCLRTAINLLCVCILFAFAYGNIVSSLRIQPLSPKGAIDLPNLYDYTESNAFSRIRVFKPEISLPFYWGAPIQMSNGTVESRFLDIDGLAGSPLIKFSSLKELEYLTHDLTNAVYQIRPDGGACIIGVGGGRDMLAALYTGHNPIVGIELNPIISNLLTKRFRQYSPIVDQPNVRIVNEEARSYLSQSRERFEVIQMSMIDTWASTSSGGFSLSENALYTVEAWMTFLGRLSHSGVFSVSRWHSPEVIGESGRALSIAVAALLRLGITDPSTHLVVLSSANLSTLLLAPNPFTREELSHLQSWAAIKGFRTTYLPGQLANDSIFEKIATAKTFEQLNQVADEQFYDLRPSTDENPYFFNMLRLSTSISQVWGSNISGLSGGVVSGNILATVFLSALILFLLILTACCFFIPLALNIETRHWQNLHIKNSYIFTGICYFSLIGAGFMFIEMGLLHRMSVFLTYPTYALSVLLFILILSSGFGSLLSEHYHLVSISRRKFYILPSAICCYVLIWVSFSSYVVASFIASSLAAKIIVAFISIAPLGVLMGGLFPIGVKLFSRNPQIFAWHWAMNSACGVLSSAIALFLSIYCGISITMIFGAGCYFGVFILLYAVRNKKSEDCTKFVDA